MIRILKSFEYPVLIISSKVGRGNVSVGEAILEEAGRLGTAYHLDMESMVPISVANEDVYRYKFISNNVPFLLNLIYRLPIFYRRKLLRENVFHKTDLSQLKNKISSLDIKTVICISHRPAFWLSILKKKENLEFKLYGVLTEFGANLGWKYIEWKMLDGYLSPLEKKDLDYPFHRNLRYFKIDPPCRAYFKELVNYQGSRDKVIFIAGYWGQIFIKKALRILSNISKEIPKLEISVVCGTNKNLFNKLKSFFENNPHIKIYGEVDQIGNLMKNSASIITKPGFSTIVEANKAKRAIFLLKGMPVAEDNNARYAISHFNAKWFSVELFKDWYYKQDFS